MQWILQKYPQLILWGGITGRDRVKGLISILINLVGPHLVNDRICSALRVRVRG
jgi:hypothetical protein